MDTRPYMKPVCSLCQAGDRHKRALRTDSTSMPHSWEPTEVVELRGDDSGGPPRLMRVRPGWKVFGARVPTRAATAASDALDTSRGPLTSTRFGKLI